MRFIKTFLTGALVALAPQTAFALAADYCERYGAVAIQADGTIAILSPNAGWSQLDPISFESTMVTLAHELNFDCTIPKMTAVSASGDHFFVDGRLLNADGTSDGSPDYNEYERAGFDSEDRLVLLAGDRLSWSSAAGLKDEGSAVDIADVCLSPSLQVLGDDRALIVCEYDVWLVSSDGTVERDVFGDLPTVNAGVRSVATRTSDGEPVVFVATPTDETHTLYRVAQDNLGDWVSEAIAEMSTAADVLYAAGGERIVVHSGNDLAAFQRESDDSWTRELITTRFDWWNLGVAASSMAVVVYGFDAEIFILDADGYELARTETIAEQYTYDGRGSGTMPFGCQAVDPSAAAALLGLLGLISARRRRRTAVPT